MALLQHLHHDLGRVPAVDQAAVGTALEREPEALHHVLQPPLGFALEVLPEAVLEVHPAPQVRRDLAEALVRALAAQHAADVAVAPSDDDDEPGSLLLADDLLRARRLRITACPFLFSIFVMRSLIVN